MRDKCRKPGLPRAIASISADYRDFQQTNMIGKYYILLLALQGLHWGMTAVGNAESGASFRVYHELNLISILSWRMQKQLVFRASQLQLKLM